MAAFLSFLPAMIFAADFIYRPAAITPPEPPREFRGAWITEVATNADWPSRPGLTAAEQKAELIALLDHAVQLHLNAVILQVRPESDAFYASPIEPWSEYLTGTMGRPPQPFYDPLAFAVAEAHKRGLELHAWFNPFRALLAENKPPVALNHISRTHPELIRHYGNQVWLDPGDPLVRQYVLRVVMDVVKRYDVDGVQFDDYFYPYPEKDSAGRVLEFPDYATWAKYGLPGGYSRDDWRRQNVNQFIQSVYQNIKAVKPWVKFGISPFGIWRPGYPKQIKGLDAYANLYADSRLWLANGWLDYFSPQLYWPVDAPQQSFPVLLNWWSAQNVKGRNFWPGLSAANVGEKFPAGEIARQIEIIRAQRGAGGEIFYHLRNLVENSALAGVIRSAYPQTALVPASPWLDSFPPNQPRLAAAINRNSGVSASWQSGSQSAWLWVLQFCGANNVWTTEILPANQTMKFFPNPAPELISIRAVDRAGNLSAPAVLKKAVPVRNGKVLI
ncbi:MAG TPA: family 10 glycosylhydrolase, partial [Candidatus Baltobacteraceae bacterium]|nr:family 10 glycosylhydrolase [Candidatus Baltobacteraceae bacterium]